ncbi:MAG: hypothetical protein J5858_15250 [Lentisphaeria bacterium]|nr:hypothetical protein [Lentisphaeria bacterium]
MGLIGMARRAGAARGAYLAAQEAYHRQRQGLYDDMARQRFDMDRREFNYDLADRDILNQRNAERFKWETQNQKNKETEFSQGQEDRKIKNQREAERFKWAQQNQQNQQTEFNQRQEDRKNFTIPANQAKLNAINRANEQAEINLQRQNSLYNQRIAAMNRMSPQERDNYLLYGANRYNPSLAQMTVKGNKTASASSSKPPFSDTRIENVAAHATPDQMRDAFDQVYNITEKDMRRKTGKTRDQFFKDVNDAYAEHIRTQGANAMTRQQFLEQYQKQYGFRPIYDLNKYMDAKNEDKANKPSAMGNWWRENIYGKPYGTYHYQRKNPTIYKKQQELEADIVSAFGGKPSAQTMALIRDPKFVKEFQKARMQGLSPQNAVQFVLGGGR